MIENEILEDLNKLSESKYKEFHSSLSPEIDNILGVRVPNIRKYGIELLKKEEPINLINTIGHTYNEEIILKGYLIGISKIEIDKKIEILEQFIPEINSWSSCDCTCSSLKFTKKYMEKMWQFIQRYIKSDNEFEVRFAVVMLLDYYITDEYVDKVIIILDNMKREEYYIKMAMAWTISVIIAKYPEKGMTYFESEDNHLSKFVYNKSIQKAIESYRISKRNKNKLKKMRRK